MKMVMLVTARRKKNKKGKMLCVLGGEGRDLNSSLVSLSFLNEPAHMNIPVC